MIRSLNPCKNQFFENYLQIIIEFINFDVFYLLRIKEL